MKVGIVTKYLGRPVGFGTYAARLLDALAQADSDIGFNLYLPSPPTRSDLPASIAIRAAKLPSTRQARAAWELILAPAAAARDGVDLIHYWYPGGPVVATGRPTVVNLFDVIEWTLPGYRKTALERMLERRHLRSAARVVAPSVTVGDDVHRVLGLPREKVVVTPLAGPPARRQPAPKRPYWLFVGGTERRKNLRLVIEAMARGGACGMAVKVVGPAGPGSRYETRSAVLSPLCPARRHEVEWLGEVDEADLDRLYAEATGLIYPSLAEGFGLPVLEAMAHHTPVITSFGVPSIADAGQEAALLVDPHDASGLSHAMTRLASDPDLRRRLVGRGLELLRGYSWEATAQGTIDLYRDLIAARGSRR